MLKIHQRFPEMTQLHINNYNNMRYSKEHIDHFSYVHQLSSNICCITLYGKTWIIRCSGNTSNISNGNGKIPNN